MYHSENGTVYTWAEPEKPTPVWSNYNVTVNVSVASQESVEVHMIELIQQTIEYGYKPWNEIISNKKVSIMLNKKMCSNWVSAKSCVLPDDFVGGVNECTAQ